MASRFKPGPSGLLIDPLNERVVGSIDRNGIEQLFPYIHAQAAVPVILAPNGTVAADGTITLIAPLQFVYAGAWVRLPAGAIVGGAAGLYWTVFSSTTVGSVKTAFADPAAQPFIPYVPSGAPAAAVGSGSAYTQTTGVDITLINVPLPGTAMGLNGALRVHDVTSMNSSANAKAKQWLLGGVAFLSNFITTSLSSQTMQILRNRGSMSAQVAFPPTSALSYSSSATGASQFSIDTSTEKTLAYTSKVPAADAGAAYVVIESFSVEILPG